MKKSIRGQGRTSVPPQKNLTEAQTQQLEQLKQMAGAYQGKSEQELMREIGRRVSEGKRDGSFSDEKMRNIAATLSPMLDEQQKKKLGQLMKNLHG